jgi:hypothetical protein
MHVNEERRIILESILLRSLGYQWWVDSTSFYENFEIPFHGYVGMALSR